MGSDEEASNTTGYTRRWLLNSVAIGTGMSVLPGLAGAVVSELTATAPGESTAATSESVDGEPSGMRRTAPTIALAVAPDEYPIALDVLLGADVMPGDVVKLYVSSSYDMSSPTIISHTITNAEALADAFAMGLSALTPATRFMLMTINDGDPSNIIAHGDTTAPTITVTGPTSAAEGNKMAVAFTIDEGANIALSGADASAVEIVGAQPGVAFTVRLLDNADLDYETKGSYTFSLRATDPAGNVGSWVPVTYNVTNNTADDPAAFNPGDKNSAINLTNGNRSADSLGSGGSSPIAVRMAGAPRTSGAWLAALRLDDKFDSAVYSGCHGFMTSTRALTAEPDWPGGAGDSSGVFRYSNAQGLQYNNGHDANGNHPALAEGDVSVMAAQFQSGTTWKVWVGTVAAGNVSGTSAAPSINVANVTWHNGSPGSSGGYSVSLTNLLFAYFPTDPGKATLAAIAGTLGSFVSLT